MDNGGQSDGKPKSQRWRGRERRAQPSIDPTHNRIQVLLARLIAVFLGALVGFLVAYIISAAFIAPLRGVDADAQEILREASAELTKIEPDYFDARQDHQSWVDKFSNAGGLDAESPADIDQELNVSGTSVEAGDDTPETEPPVPMESPAAETAEQVEPEEVTGDAPAAAVATITLEQFLVIRQEYTRLKNQRQRLIDRIDYWEQERLDYQRQIDLLNALGIAIVVVFVLVGYMFYPLVLLGIRRLARQLEQLTSGFEQRTAQATVGFFAGLVLAMVILLAVFNMFGAETTVLNYPWFRLLFGAFVVIVVGICGSLVGVSYFGPAGQSDPYKEFKRIAPPKVLDTSVIIDGRIHEVCTTGFLGGMLVVTNSVLRELQNMADSANERKRTKGRRGLELLRKMQDDPRMDISVYDDSPFDIQAQSTDEQLILVSQAMGGMVVTNDYNLNRVAAIRDVRVININALANAVKTTHLPGDIIDIQILDRGKQRGQGVGYLDDGTMVVVEDGEPFIGNSKTLKITSVSQTVQGRLLFGRVDLVQE